MQKRESVIKVEVLYAAASWFLELSLGIKDSASNSTCCRHAFHLCSSCKDILKSVQREKQNHLAVTRDQIIW